MARSVIKAGFSRMTLERFQQLPSALLQLHPSHRFDRVELLTSAHVR